MPSFVRSTGRPLRVRSLRDLSHRLTFFVFLVLQPWPSLFVCSILSLFDYLVRVCSSRNWHRSGILCLIWVLRVKSRMQKPVTSHQTPTTHGKIEIETSRHKSGRYPTTSTAQGMVETWRGDSTYQNDRKLKLCKSCS